MSLRIPKENRLTLALGVVFILTSAGGLAAGQLRHAEVREHSDLRWHDLDQRLSRVEDVCRLKEGR